MYDGVSVSGGSDNGAFQAGIKLFDAFGLKNLFLQYEFNYVSVNSYRNPNYPAQDYSHYGQSLTTPALFPNEHVGMISYTYKRVFIQLKENYSSSDITGFSVNYFDGKIGYMVNPHYNFNISVGSTLRTTSNLGINAKPQQMQLIYVSLRTSLYNLYYDF
jgi:hypothetical protein